MPTGDTLQVIGLAIGAMIGALTTSGRRSAFLWGLTGALALLAFVYAGLVPHVTISVSWVDAAVRSLLAPVTIGVVALMLRERRGPIADSAAPPNKPQPIFATAPSSKWQPDIKLRQGIGYLGAKSMWREPFSAVGNTMDGTIRALTDALASNKITAWGREHPEDSEMFQISPAFWMRVDVTAETDFAFSHVRNVGAYKIQLCQKEMELVWPPKDDPKKIPA